MQICIFPNCYHENGEEKKEKGESYQSMEFIIRDF